MDEAQIWKRKLQNRNAQRRCRSRKKGNDRAFFHSHYMKETPGNANIEPPAITTSSWSLPDTLPTTTIPEPQTFFNGIDFSDLSVSNGSEDPFTEVLGSSVFGIVPTPTPMLSLSNDIAAKNGGRCNHTADCQFDQGGLMFMSPTIFSNNEGQSSKSTEALLSPISINSSMETSNNTNSGAENAGLGAISSHLPVNSASSNHQCQGKRENNSHKSTRFAHRMKDNQQPSHKAEMMISDVQELCKFGLRFGLLVTEDNELRDCLSFLRGKLREMSRCSNKSVHYSSSSDEDID
ncbi:hypothetical protein TruAng_005609 [Truncatella angustata]|nr:hypothetical protein TruAng_005609 [Truncatella angustata]